MFDHTIGQHGGAVGASARWFLLQSEPFNVGQGQGRAGAGSGLLSSELLLYISCFSKVGFMWRNYRNSLN